MTQPAKATDPVCGMDVDMNHNNLMSQHKGQTVYFCSAGCKQSFDRDPAKYTDNSHQPSMLGAMLGRVRDMIWDRRP